MLTEEWYSGLVKRVRREQQARNEAGWEIVDPFALAKAAHAEGYAAALAAREQEPVAYRYRYADPFTGNPIWRNDCMEWNGRRPTETQALYAHPAPARSQERREVAWLIETTTGQYWCGGKCGWTPSPNLACRFARAEDAHAAREWLRIPPIDIRVTEHVWLDAPARSQEEA